MFLSEYYVKDSVGAAAGLVHVGGSNSPAQDEKITTHHCVPPKPLKKQPLQHHIWGPEGGPGVPRLNLCWPHVAARLHFTDDHVINEFAEATETFRVS